MVVAKIFEALGVVKENVGIENEVFTEGEGSLETVAVSGFFPATVSDWRSLISVLPKSLQVNEDSDEIV
jgi:hypothetical protein